MTKPLKVDDTRESGLKAHEASVEHPPGYGSQAVLQETSSETAGVAQGAPRQFSSDEVLRLLAEAVQALESSGKPPVAAGVSAKMRNLNPDFALQRTEFSTFRQVLKEAQRAGIVNVSEGRDDVFITLARSVGASSHSGLKLRSDLWRAINDRSEDARYAYNRATRRTLPVDGEISDGEVLVPSIGKQVTEKWMQAFAARSRGDERDKLELALSEQDPIVGFERAVKGTDSLKRRWSRHLRQGALQWAEDWIGENGIPPEDVFVASSRQTGVPAQTTQGESDEEALRQRILSALATMPLSELLRLPVPLEYVLSR